MKTLSDKIFEVKDDKGLLYSSVRTKYIKEFIKQLKEEFTNEAWGESAWAVKKIINKLAGDKLIGEAKE